MPGVGEIVGALQQASEDLHKAQSAAAQLDAGAQRVQSRASGTGFRAAATERGQSGSLIAIANGIKHALAHVAGCLDTAKRRTDQTP